MLKKAKAAKSTLLTSNQLAAKQQNNTLDP